MEAGYDCLGTMGQCRVDVKEPIFFFLFLRKKKEKALRFSLQIYWTEICG